MRGSENFISKGYTHRVSELHQKTDEERIQNMPELYERLKNEQTNLIVTEKVDGCSGTYFYAKFREDSEKRSTNSEFAAEIGDCHSQITVTIGKSPTNTKFAVFLKS